MNPDDAKLDAAMQESFNKLPRAVQDAITSADVEKHLRELSDKHKLHLDQWTLLENEVMLTLLGIEPIANLASNIQSEVGVDSATAIAIAADVSQIVFAPIRGELERLLGHPQAEAVASTPVDQVRAQALSAAHEAETSPVTTAVPVMPATPPPAPPTQKVERAPISAAYAPGAASHERKSVEGDPYREQLV